jgi:hypothetical protein
MVVMALGHGIGRRQNAEQAQLPFSVELGAPFTFDGVPGLHSFAYARADVDGTKWLFVSGRKAGLHGFVSATLQKPASSFPPEEANDRIWVIDVAKRRVWSLELAALPKMDPPLDPTIDPNQWRATNTLSCQAGDKLYIVGGYGLSPGAPASSQNITFGKLTVMQVSGVVKAVIAGKSIAPHVAQMSDNRLKLTGGELLPFPGSKIDGDLCAVFGQTFDKPYTADVSSTGTYSEHIARFRVVERPALKIEDYKSYPSSFVFKPTPLEIDGYSWADFTSRVKPYNRRDLNVLPARSPADVPRIGVYGGVFRPGRFEAWLEPIYIESVATKEYEREGKTYTYDTFFPGTDHDFEQLLNQYRCAAMPIYDSGSGQKVTVFFGGIANYRYDSASHQLIKDPVKLGDGGRPIVDGVPFIQTVTSLAVDKNGKSSASILPISMPGFLGAEAKLLLNPSIPLSDNGVIRLDKISGPTQMGVIYGGIESCGPYTGELEQNGVKPSSVAYNKFIPLVITPGNWPVKPMPPKPGP